MSRIRVASVGLVAALSVGLAGCATAQDGPNDVLSAMQARQQADVAATAAARSATTSGTAAATKCSPPADASYPPLPSVPSKGAAGSLLAEIQSRGYLVVGVSGDTRLLGARNSQQGGNLEGFDIDLARAIARAALGGDDPARLRFRVITAGERFSLVNKGVKGGGVDLVARAVSMTCDRWQDKTESKGSLFSAGYFESRQQLLVRSDLGIKGIDQLKSPANRVCAANASTSLANLAKHPNVQPVAAEIHSDCLALWQEGRVDAITGDDAILAGFADQDPRATVVGTALDTTYYGFAVGRAHPDFVQYVNAVMASAAFRDAWTQSYAKWLAPRLGARSMPAPDYGRSLS